MRPKKEHVSHRAAWIKGIALLIILLGAIIVVRSPALRPYFTAQGLSSSLDGLGPWAPLAYVLVFGIVAAFPIPATILVAAGAALFGLWIGLGLTVIGALIAATIAFLLARTLGRDLARRFAGDTLRRYDDRLSKDGFRTVLYLRLLLIPFAPLNYAAGLSGVRMRDYLLATAIGVVPASFFITFFVATVRDVALEHGIVSWELVRALMRWDVLLAALLLLACFSIPHIVRWRSTRKRSRKK